MVEAFAKSLIDKIMLEAFDVVDTNEKGRKQCSIKCRLESDMLSNASEPAPAITQAPINEAAFARGNDFQTPDMIAKILRGICDIQIGDTTYVLQPTPSILEQQIKHAIRNIEVTTLDDSPEKRTTQGEGDANQIVPESRAEVPEAALPDARSTGREKENNETTEAQRISVSLLHRMVEDFERRTDGVEVSTWEEREETFVRVVDTRENTCDENDVKNHYRTGRACPSGHNEPENSSPVIESPIASSSRHIACVHEIELKDITSAQENKEKTPYEIAGNIVKLSSPSTSGTAVTTSSVLSSDDARESSAKLKKSQKKTGRGARLKRFLRSAFGCRKN